MIGNDVVDLQLAPQQTNWKRPGFIQKVLNQEEQEWVFSIGDTDSMFWLLWSMKEAAYKAHQRHLDLPRQSNWLDYECNLTCFSKKKAIGMVNIGDYSYFSKSVISSEMLYTTALGCEEMKLKNKISQQAVSRVKQDFIKQISHYFQLSPNQLKLQKNTAGIPYLSSPNGSKFSSFSFSGHGQYYAYVFSLMNY